MHASTDKYMTYDKRFTIQTFELDLVDIVRTPWHDRKYNDLPQPHIFSIFIL